jgi:hypothetical protein
MTQLQTIEPKIYESPYPLVELSSAPLWDFMFKKKQSPEKEAQKIVYVEEDTGEQLRSNNCLFLCPDGVSYLPTFQVFRIKATKP